MRFGIDSIASTKPQFGSRGWVHAGGVAGGLDHRLELAADHLLREVRGAAQRGAWLLDAGLAQRDAGALLTVFACDVIFAALRRGATGVSMVSNILFAHVFVGLWMLYLLVSHRWPELIAAQPALASPDRLWNYTTGVELGIGATLSWWPYIGAMIRMAPNGRTIVLPVMLGMGRPVPLLSLIGLAGVLVLKSSDPAEWLRTVGGPTYAIVSLAFVTAANFGTTTAGIYASAIGLRNFRVAAALVDDLAVDHDHPGRLGRHLHSGVVFRQIRQFSGVDGVAFAPLCGIQIIDYFVLRRRHIDRRAIYFDAAGRPYYFWRGINPAAMLALAAGCCTYMSLLNPLTFQSRGPYAFVSASLPAAGVAAMVYYLGSLWVIRAGRGGYKKG